MDKERKLYNKFVEKLNELLDNPDITPKELNIILDFLKAQNIQATEDNEELKKLLNGTNSLYDFDELPVKRFK